MNEKDLYDLLITIVISLSPVIAFVLLRISAPYGRHSSNQWGPRMPFKAGWVIMESAALLSFNLAYLSGVRIGNPLSILFLLLWNLHYLDRTILYPIQMPASNKHLPLLVLASGFLFNTINGYLNGRFLTYFGPPYSLEWLLDPRFILGIALFIAGFLINRYADRILFKLRKERESGYKIPYGFIYKYISCPNYFGEIMIWCGWACATWSLPGLAFAIFTAANLVPRAYAHHRWYLKTFSNYPKRRKAIIPFVL